MKKGGGKNKGSQFERDISKKLSLWWTQDLPIPRDDVFWKTSGSGGRATNRTKNKKKTVYEYGDITFTDPVGKPLIDCFLIECKKGYKQNNLFDFFSNKQRKDSYFEWWGKAKKEAQEANRKNCILIVSLHRREIIVFINSDFFNNQSKYTGEWKKEIIKVQYNLSYYFEDIYIIRLDDFLFRYHRI